MTDDNNFEEGDQVKYEYRGEVKEGEVVDMNKTMFGDYTYRVEFEDGSSENGVGGDQLEEV